MNTTFEYRSYLIILMSTTGISIPIYGCSPTGNMQQHRKTNKNIVMIAVDDLKPLLGCYEDPRAVTPNIDKIAAQGVVFEMAYCQEALSAPTRASLLTGLCPDRTQVWDLETKIRDKVPNVVTLPQYLISCGYVTAGIGKVFDTRSVDKNNDEKSWSVPFIKHDKYYNKDYGTPLFKEYQNPVTLAEYKERSRNGEEGLSALIKPTTECLDIPDDAYHDGAVAAGAVDFIEHYQCSSPFFLAVGFKKPHLPFCAPKKYWELYDKNEIPLAKFRKKAIKSPDIAYHNSGELKKYSDISPIYQYSDIENTILPDEKAKELIHGYYAAVSYMDAQVGKVLDAIEKSGKKNNTIIILWGDHGWHLGDHGLWNKHSNFEQATRVPMIIVDPSAHPDKITTPIEFLDIYPTLCDLIGVPVPSGLDGTSLTDLIYGKKESVKKYAVSQYHRYGNKMGYSIRNQRYRYTIWVDWSGRVTNVDKVYDEELYDYVNDPDETINVVSDPKYRDALKLMKSYWKEYKKKMALTVNRN